MSELVGTQGQLSQRATLGSQTHGWSESVGSVNSLIEFLGGPVSEMQEAIGAVAAGDLSKNVNVPLVPVRVGELGWRQCRSPTKCPPRR